MRAVISQRAAEQLAAAPDNIARTFFQAARPPSPRSPSPFARITKGWRFYFIEGDIYSITNANEHPK